MRALVTARLEWAAAQHHGGMNMSDLIKLTPIFTRRFSGRQLETVFGYDIPEGPIGECWAISAHPNGDCQIAEGPYAGHTLSWLWAEHRELFGNCEGKEFPLLIKILDAKDDLSIQIHPNDEYAAEHENGSLGKTECWYVLDCEPGATIIVGQRAHDRAEAARTIEDGRWDDMLNVLPIHKGDFFQIDSGTVHAIKTGTLILETQQSSDVTYRLYDYDRPGTDGKLRPLHIEQSLDCIDFNVQAPTDGTVTAPEVDGVTELESNPATPSIACASTAARPSTSTGPSCVCRSSTAKAPSAATLSTREATCWPRAPSAPLTSKARWN